MAIIKPGHNNLNMEDISSDLRYVHHHVVKLDVDKREDNDITKPVKEKYRYLTQKADDTDLVGGVRSQQIAISVEGDRETVRNAQMIDGHGFEDLMSKGDAGSLDKSVKLISKNVSNEITSLRDELYQLRSELTKKGIIENQELHFGFTDIFRTGYTQYDAEVLAQPLEDPYEKIEIRLTSDVIAKLDVGDYVAIYYKDAEAVEVRQIRNINADTDTITLDRELNPIYTDTAENILIYKSFGTVQNGNFYFANNPSMKIGDTESWSGLDDDTAYTFQRRITNTEQGYAYSFRIPESKRGYLTKFQIQARCAGSPTLNCCIIDEEDIGFFKNPNQAEALYLSGDTRADGEPKMHFFAKATPVTLDPSLDKTVYTFNFYDTSTGTYPLINRDDSLNYRVRYVAIITASFADANNYASIMFLQNNNNSTDLETNNIVYQVNLQDELSPTNALNTSASLNEADMYYGVTLREALNVAINPVSQGLYTKTIATHDPEGIARARLTLRIGREGGLWYANIPNTDIYGITTNNKAIPVECTPAQELRNVSVMGISNQIQKPLELRKNEYDNYQYPDIIIGGNITSGSGENTLITVNDPIVIKPKDMVYRNAYIVSVKGKLKEFNPETNAYDTVKTKKIYLKPVAIIQNDNNDLKNPYSDRIIFENDFTDEKGELEFFNELELQIYWENQNFSDSNTIKARQVGIIRDLVFTVDRIAK